MYITSDSIAHAVHRSFDSILASIESATLTAKLRAVLDGARRRLPTVIRAYGRQAVADVDVYLAVASGLLADATADPVAGGNAGVIGDLIVRAQEGTGSGPLPLFGAAEKGDMVDWSQEKPRGHYTQTSGLSAYFRATMWLGRVGMTVVRGGPDGDVLDRRALAAALACRAAFDDPEAHAAWADVEAVVTGFFGPADGLSFGALDGALRELGVATPPNALALPDAKLISALKTYGTQRIRTHPIAGGHTETSFRPMGQRYAFDSDVLSAVVHDRVAARMMPSPLDVGWAVLHNQSARSLLVPELTRFASSGYEHALSDARDRGDQEPAAFWRSSLYHGWIGALRALAPVPGTPEETGLPAVARTEPWRRRMLDAQLASWAELRHDSLLYVEQSGTAGLMCQYPDAYVDPYPDFFRGFASFAAKGREIVGSVRRTLGYLGGGIEAYFAELERVTTILANMADSERADKPFTDAELAFVNEAVALKVQNAGCTTVSYPVGWYAHLFYGATDAMIQPPTIADVHTQPTDENGNVVGRVLHVATGSPRMMTVRVETCHGSRTYVGPVSSYYEIVTKDYERLTDDAWAARIAQSAPPDVPWMVDLIAR